MKNLIKYLFSGAVTAGVTAPVTYFTTREDFTKDQRYLDISDEIKKIEGEKESLGKEIEEKEEKISKLRGCLNTVEVIPHTKKVGGIMKTEKIVVFNRTHRTCRH